MGVGLTLVFVHTQNDNDFVPANPNKLLDGSNTSSGKLRKQNHSVNVVVFKKLDVGAHLGDLSSTC